MHVGEHGAVPGRQIYERSCSSCHGLDARGNGPVAEFLAVPVPDLTRIAARRGGIFPQAAIFRIVDGQSALSPHGTRHMPVWGYEFFGSEGDDEEAHAAAVRNIDALVEYLRVIQRPE
jgi:mono/diheme cytochrome c family protein